MAQTAMEQLIEWIDSDCTPMDCVMKAKELLKTEKEQHDVTFSAGYDYRSSKEKDIIEAFGMNSKPTFDQYYSQTYGCKQNEDLTFKKKSQWTKIDKKQQ